MSLNWLDKKLKTIKSWGRYSLARQVLHFSGGCVIMLAAWGFSHLWDHAVGVVAGIAMAILFIQEREQYLGGQSPEKTIIDLFAWTSGLICTMLILN